ncbi:MAG: glycosyltransferase family 4 protein [Pseudomonadota bacterium]
MHPSARLVRVLYLQPGAMFGGAERQAATSIPLLPSFGIEVIPLVGPGQAVVDWLVERGVDNSVFSQDFPGAWKKPRGIARLFQPWRYCRCYWALQRTIHRLAIEESIDLVYAALPFSWVVATPVARRLRLPVIWRAGGTEVSEWQARALNAYARFRPPDLLVCCGEAVKRVYGAFVPAPTLVVRSGVDTAQFHPDAGDPTAFRPRSSEVVVGFAARLVREKRPEDFLAMAARLAHHHGVSFLVAGEGSLRAAYENMARELGCAANVRFLGYVADMRSFYASCDVFVLSSRSEGCPNVVLEAMAMRRALVVSDAAGTTEVIAHDKEGLIYKMGDVDALARAVQCMISSAERRRMLADNGYRHVVSDYSAQAHAARLAELFRKYSQSAAASLSEMPGIA